MSNHVENGSGDKYFDLKKMPHIVKPLDRRQKVLPDVLSVIGNTPLVKLNRIPQSMGVECDVFVKCEYLNPGGSVKDRIAYRMVQEAEQSGRLIPGKSVIIEPTSGNTGIGLSLAAAIKGYRCIIVLPEKMSDEKVNTMLALGSEIIRTPTEVSSDSPESNLSVAKRLTEEIPHAVMLDQYSNPCNPLAHYDGTAEEILWSMDDDLDMVVLGAGTSGTISGVGHKIKERCPKCTVVGVDPYGSILAQPEALNKTDVTYYEVEGLGYDFMPGVLDRSVIDKWVKAGDREALPMSRRLIKEEGILCGGSSGSAVWAAMQAAKELKKGQRCVVLLPDNIRNYMTKFIMDQWMEARSLQPLAHKDNLWWWGVPVPESLAERAASVGAGSSAAGALLALREAGARALAVLDGAGSVMGIFTSDDARKKVVNLGSSLAESVDKFINKKFYKVDLSASPTLGQVSRMLDMAPFIYVVKSDSSGVQRPVGAITSDDLMLYIAKDKKNANGN